VPDELQVSFQEFVDRSLSRPGIGNFFAATGIRIHYLEWAGPPGAPALLLLHGFLGNAHWWDFVAPWLAEDYRVIAPDFGGMGDSGHRARYRYEDFVAEVGAVIEHARLAPCTVIGHSFGGRTTLFACAEFAPLIRHAIVVDSRLATRDDPIRPRMEAGRPKKRYASVEEMLPRFRLQPDEPAPAATRLHLARESLRADGDAFVWKFDEQVTQLFRAGDGSGLESQSDRLANLPMPVDVICGGNSKVCSLERARHMVAAIHTARGPVVIPTANHHIPIGHPLALLAALRGVLAVEARSRQ
jgi:pimeloyl-ACP methyl ester carboxylesterase